MLVISRECLLASLKIGVLSPFFYKFVLLSVLYIEEGYAHYNTFQMIFMAIIGNLQNLHLGESLIRYWPLPYKQWIP